MGVKRACFTVAALICPATRTVQTFFLAIADMVYRRANLEHAAASAPNMMQNGLLIRLLAIEKHASQTMIETRLAFQGDGTASGGLCLRSEGLTGAT